MPGCQRVTGPACEFSSLHDNVYEEVRLRVRAEEGGRASPWRELDPFIPFQRGERQLVSQRALCHGTGRAPPLRALRPLRGQQAPSFYADTDILQAR